MEEKDPRLRPGEQENGKGGEQETKREEGKIKEGRERGEAEKDREREGKEEEG